MPYGLAAYSDIGVIVASEIVIQATSRIVLSSLPDKPNFNFDVHLVAGELLVQEDFTDSVTHDRDKLDPIFAQKSIGFLQRDFESAGSGLVELTCCCIERAVRAYDVSLGILRNDECLEQRRIFSSIEQPQWLDRINTGLGFALYTPVPQFGIGSRQVSNVYRYNGTFRRNHAEGYGRLTAENGRAYFGQVRDGNPNGYGVEVNQDGTILVGHFNPHERTLGALVSSDQAKLVVGAHGDRGVHGYARQLGLRDGIESVSGFWIDGELTHPVQTYADIYRSLNKKHSRIFKGTDYGRELDDKERDYSSKEDKNDREILACIQALLPLELPLR